MANEYGLFWNSVSSDRLYDADSFSEWLRKFFTTGVFNGELQVLASSGMDVTVQTGYANIDGKVRFFDTATTFTLAPASGTYPRIDTIVVERNDTDREITIKYVQGTYSGNTPVPTAPVRAAGVYQIVLAQIYVAVGATEIAQGNITDTRADNTLCGWVVGTVDEIDVEQMTAQAQADFNAWYQQMKDQLSEDAAGRLQTEIDELSAKVIPVMSTTTLLSTGWVDNVYSFETDYPALSYDIEIELNGDSATEEQVDAWSSAMILGSATTNTFIALGDVPEVNIPVILRVVSK